MSHMLEFRSITGSHYTNQTMEDMRMYHFYITHYQITYQDPDTSISKMPILLYLIFAITVYTCCNMLIFSFLFEIFSYSLSKGSSLILCVDHLWFELAIFIISRNILKLVRNMWHYVIDIIWCFGFSKHYLNAESECHNFEYFCIDQ